MYENFVVDEEQNTPIFNIPPSYATFTSTDVVTPLVISTPVSMTPSSSVVLTPVVTPTSSNMLTTPTPVSTSRTTNTGVNQNMTISGNVGQTISVSNGTITTSSNQSGGGIAIGVLIFMIILGIASYIALIYFGLKIRKQCGTGDNQNNLIAIGLIISIILMFTPLSPLASIATLIMIILGANICGK